MKKGITSQLIDLLIYQLAHGRKNVVMFGQVVSILEKRLDKDQFRLIMQFVISKL